MRRVPGRLRSIHVLAALPVLLFHVTAAAAIPQYRLLDGPIEDVDQRAGSSLISENNGLAVLKSESGDLPYRYWSVVTGTVPIEGPLTIGRRPADISDVGVVVGTGSAADAGTERAYAWTVEGGMVDLGDLGGGRAEAWRVSNAGIVVGQSTNEAGESRAFRWSAESGMVDLGTLGGPEAGARDVTEDGDVVGWSLDEEGTTRAALWRDGTVLDLGTLGGEYAWTTEINEAGQVVGVSETVDGERRSFFWEDGEMIEVPLLIRGFNARGEIAGRKMGERNSYYWSRESGAVLIESVGGDGSRPDGITDGGIVFGDDFGRQDAYLWTADTGMVTIDKLAGLPVEGGTQGEGGRVFVYTIPTIARGDGTVIAWDLPGTAYVLAEIAPSDGDRDGDGVDDSIDNCPFDVNVDQADRDGDGVGDVCDEDDDGDGVPDDRDQDPFDPNVGEAVTVRIERRILSSGDDVEERAGGRVAFDSSDLELVSDGGFAQTVGLRFTDLAIPQGATIVDAEVLFFIDEASDEPTALTIRGVASGDASRWRSTPHDVSTRPRTDASVDWSPPPWPRQIDVGLPETRSPDLSSVVQEIVDRADWEPGNALSLVIDGSGRRVARSYDRPDKGAEPRLTVRYTAAGGNEPPYVTVIPSSYEVPLSETLTLTGSVRDDGLPAVPGTTSVEWRRLSGPGTVDFVDPRAATTATSFSAAGRHELELRAFDGALSGFDRVVVTVTGDAGEQVVERRVARSGDDAEEAIPAEGGPGPIDLDSSDLELVVESTPQLVGLRFADLGIPPGASITRAWVRFTVDEPDGGAAADLIIGGERAADAVGFDATPGNLSSRPRTAATVSWAPPPWTRINDTGDDQRTPDLSAVVQEIVDGEGWRSGNALVLLVDGRGQRIAESFDGERGSAPLLHVEYR